MRYAKKALIPVDKCFYSFLFCYFLLLYDKKGGKKFPYLRFSLYFCSQLATSHLFSQGNVVEPS